MKQGMGENRESGFINSEPCIAEFMTSVPHINHNISPSITSERDAVGNYCQTFNGALPASPTRAEMAVGGGTPDGREAIGGAGKYGEFPWMKDKKPVRKGEPPQTVPDIGMDIFLDVLIKYLKSVRS